MHTRLAQAYNLVWTSIPILCIGILDRDVSNETARKLPQLYHMGIRSFYWNRYVILRWFLEALYESVLISILCILSLNMLGSQATDPSVYYIGAHTLTIVIIVVNLKLFLWKFEQSRITNTVIAISILLWFPLAFVAQVCSLSTSSSLATYVTNWCGLWQNVLAEAAFWLLIPVVGVACLVPQFLLELWLRQFYPQFRDLVLEAESLGLDLSALARWEIPAEKRRLPLVKDAPRPPRPPSLWDRCRASAAELLGRPKAPGTERRQLEEKMVA